MELIGSAQRVYNYCCRLPAHDPAMFVPATDTWAQTAGSQSHLPRRATLSLLPLKQQNRANIVSRAKEGFLLRWLIGENQFMEQEYIFVVSPTQGTGFGAAVEQCLGRVNSIAASRRNEWCAGWGGRDEEAAAGDSVFAAVSFPSWLLLHIVATV